MIGLPRSSTSDDLAPGTMVGEYKVEARIGAGGMGVVYGAIHPVIGKRAAIKLLNSKYIKDREELERFVLEAQAVNRIGHENIVDIFSFGHLDDGRWYFVMEWLIGETLAARLVRAPLTLADTVTIVTSLCNALEAAHGAGIIHRDLKPENVFLRNNDPGRVKLLDFGIAKLTGGDNANRTATGIVVGTPMYMSPEQASGAPLDARTDIYTLGVVLYAMVCGKTPFQDLHTGVEIMTAHLRSPPPPPRSLNPSLAPELEQLLLEMLAKEAPKRPTLPQVRARLAALPKTARPVATAAASAPTIVTGVEAPRVTPHAAPSPIATRGRRKRRFAIAGLLLTGSIVAIAVFASSKADTSGTAGSSDRPSPPAHVAAPNEASTVAPSTPRSSAPVAVEPSKPVENPPAPSTKPPQPTTVHAISRPQVGSKSASTKPAAAAKATDVQPLETKPVTPLDAGAPSVNPDRVHDPFHH